MEKSLDKHHNPIKKGILWNHIAAFSKQNVTMPVTHKSSKRKKGKKGKRRFTAVYLNLLGKRDSKGKNTEEECSRKETGKQEAETVLRL